METMKKLMEAYLKENYPAAVSLGFTGDDKLKLWYNVPCGDDMTTSLLTQDEVVKGELPNKREYRGII